MKNAAKSECLTEALYLPLHYAHAPESQPRSSLGIRIIFLNCRLALFVSPATAFRDPFFRYHLCNVAEDVINAEAVRPEHVNRSSNFGIGVCLVVRAIR